MRQIIGEDVNLLVTALESELEELTSSASKSLTMVATDLHAVRISHNTERSAFVSTDSSSDNVKWIL
jgi:hypothetical protein